VRPIDTKLETELRRGIFQIAVLSLLREPRYGYLVGQVLAENGLAVEEGTLYPLLRRMEEQGLLESWWLTEEARPRKYYRTTPDGVESLALLVETWGRVDASLRRILEANKGAPQPPAGGEGASHA
jgi:PadR family transcriptional regulator PadR